MNFRIGQGFDVHAFRSPAEGDCGDHLVIGGVRIPHERGLKAHSDGDVLLHALADAILGALALGDIGHHFPDSDSRYAGADSRALLRQVMELAQHRGYRLVNADTTVIAQAPKMAPHIDAMRSNIAADCAVAVSAVSVKATTTEGLGFTGRKEGIAAQAAVLLEGTHV
ncbi:2-C-methyl-D-erythritol 2,4-cyclodiphosphate synthase [Microbulbifer sp. TYP-18]|uniref:2-C-methyl-D-erythritol 2,4-cyclodiphosphate synthase n=1 Tax=Microbulbifer sp. TYP-18 TaxID=3230024 RepID=UPI0034C5B9A7